MPDQKKPSRKVTLPHPDDLAARRALALMQPAPIGRILIQAAASRKFITELRAKGLPDLPPPPCPPFPR
jgi:hypothetical protein